MNQQLTSIFNQMRIVIESIVVILDQLSEDDLSIRPADHKRSVRELIDHISLICKADFLILNETTQEQMEAFYASQTLHELADVKRELLVNHTFLKEQFTKYSETELFEMKQSYWGVSYSRFEWLLQILCHLYHHRAQLHTIVTSQGKELHVNLFE
ncbi:DinB family protein [Paenibacillus sp. KN14-4R]|uniref:DinB family protein n=1 Tax=Paenibacillus sp. KN14-4R TaxID=3445773 RepID=UPI003F9FDD62